MKSQVLDLFNPLWMEILQKIRHDVYQLPSYIALEAGRQRQISEAIVIEEGDRIFFVPYVLSAYDETMEAFDATSPYGYPGILLSDAARLDPAFVVAALQEFKRILYSKGVCSLFLRMHPILNHDFDKIFPADTLTPNGETVSIDLRIPKEQLWPNTRKGHKSTINKCKRLGMVASMVPIEEYLHEFNDIYQETMRRVSATTTYYSFDYDYYRKMSDLLGAQLHLCIVEYENQIASVGLYTEVGGIVQSTLGGTRDKFVELSPSSLETDYVRYWALDRGNEFLHLGGGVGGARDSLYDFKAGFSKLTHNFYTMRLTIDQEKYDDLVQKRAKHLNTTVSALVNSNFFPAYRAQA
jgi:FemAB family